MPESELSKLTLGEIGPDLMRQIVDEVQRRNLKRFKAE
jgi:hypothetical protein